MRYLLATCTFIGTLILSQAAAEAVSVRVDIEPGKRIVAPRDAIKFVVRPSGDAEQPDANWTCTASLVDQATGTSVWSKEKKLSNAKATSDGLLFSEKAPRQAGVYQLQIELQSQTSISQKLASQNPAITQHFPLIVVAPNQAEHKGFASLLGGRSDSAEDSAQIGSSERSLAKWYSASELASPLGLTDATTSDSINWTQVYQHSEQFIDSLRSAGFDAAALPLAAGRTILFPMAGPKGERLANAAEVDILELLLHRADQAGVKLYLTLPGKAVSAASPAVGGDALVSNAPVLVLESSPLQNEASNAYLTAFDSTRHQIPWVVSRAVRQIASRYTDHESLAAIVIDNRALPTTTLRSDTLSSLHAMPVINAADSGQVSLNKQLAQQLSLTNADVFFVAGHSRQSAGDALSWKMIDQSKLAKQLSGQLVAVRSEVNAMRLHRVENCLLNPSFETPSAISEGHHVPGWRVEPTAHAEASIDPTGSHAGAQCLLMQSQTASKTELPAVSIQSGPFELPATRRLAVLTWMRVDPQLPTPDVHLVLEGKYNGETFRHSVEAAQIIDSSSQDNSGNPALGDQWTPVTLQLDDLPMGGISELTVSIELHSAGSVWVDDLQVSDMWLTDAEQATLTRSIDNADDNLTAGRLAEAREIVEQQLSASIAKFGALQYLAPSLISNTTETDAVSSPQEQADTPALAEPEPVANNPINRLPMVAGAAPTASGIVVSEVAKEQPAQQTELANAPIALPVLPPLNETSILPIGSEGDVSGSAVSGNNVSGSIASKATLTKTVDSEAAKLAVADQPWWKFWGSQPDSAQSKEVATTNATTAWSRRASNRNNSPRSRPNSEQEFSRPQAAVASIWSYLKPSGDETPDSSISTVPALTLTKANSLPAVQVTSSQAQSIKEPTRLFGFLPRLGGQSNALNSGNEGVSSITPIVSSKVSSATNSGNSFETSSETAPEAGKAFGLARLWSLKDKTETEPIAGSEPIDGQPDSFSLFGLLTGESDAAGESVADVKAEAVQIAEVQTAKAEQTVSRIAQLVPGSQPVDSSSKTESSDTATKPIERLVNPIVNFFRK